MFCGNCGNKLREGARFCPKCGAAVKAAADAATSGTEPAIAQPGITAAGTPAPGIQTAGVPAQTASVPAMQTVGIPAQTAFAPEIQTAGMPAQTAFTPEMQTAGVPEPKKKGKGLRIALGITIPILVLGIATVALAQTGYSPLKLFSPKADNPLAVTMDGVSNFLDLTSYTTEYTVGQGDYNSETEVSINTLLGENADKSVSEYSIDYGDRNSFHEIFYGGKYAYIYSDDDDDYYEYFSQWPDGYDHLAGLAINDRREYSTDDILPVTTFFDHNFGYYGWDKLWPSQNAVIKNTHFDKVAFVKELASKFVENISAYLVEEERDGYTTREELAEIIEEATGYKPTAKEMDSLYSGEYIKINMPVVFELLHDFIYGYCEDESNLNTFVDVQSIDKLEDGETRYRYRIDMGDFLETFVKYTRQAVEKDKYKALKPFVLIYDGVIISVRNLSVLLEEVLGYDISYYEISVDMTVDKGRNIQEIAYDVVNTESGESHFKYSTKISEQNTYKPDMDEVTAFMEKCRRNADTDEDYDYL